MLSSGIQSQSSVPVNILSKWIVMDEENVFSALTIAFVRLACRCSLSVEHIHKILTKILKMYDRKLLHSNIKIEILNFLCNISELNLRLDDKNSDVCLRMISSLIGKLYRDNDVMVSEECAAVLLASSNPILFRSLNYDIRLKSEIADLPKCISKTANARNYLSKRDLAQRVQYEHKCVIKNNTNSSITVRRNDTNRLTLGFDFEIDDATELTINLRHNANALVELHRVSGLSHDIIESVGKIVNTLSKIK